MANLFGTGINQIPTNGMLGNLAFQDKAYVGVDAIGIGTTFVDSGTVGQVLQVTGGAYVSGNLGIGTTNPTSKLHVIGDVRVTGVVTATTFVGALTGTATSTTNIPNLTGAITSNNTTTSLGSFSSANLSAALTDETGSGAAVFATSPTLVTPSLGAATATSINASGIITATQLSTGASGTGVNITTDTISGPATLTIDPAAVGDNTGAVRIKGDLYVDGTQFIVNSTTIELADFNVGIATTVGTNALLDGAGIGIGSTGIRKTLTWSNGSTALKSREDFDVASGKVYKIAGTSVLSNNTLGSGVVNSSLTSVGTLGQLQVTGVSTFTNGPILVGTVTPTGTASQRLQVDGGAYVSGNLGIGTTNPQRKLHLRAMNADGIFLDGSDQTGNNGAPTLRVRGQRVDSNASQSFSGQLVLEKWRMDASINSGQNLGAIIFGGNYDTLPGITTGMTYGASIGAMAEGTFSGIGTAPTAIVFNTGTIGLGTITLSNATYGIEAARITSNRNLLIGTTTETGTASQRLQVDGGAYVSGVGFATGSIGVGITNPQGTIDIRTSPQWNSFNWGANLVIGGARNNGLVVLDSGNTNPWGISNGSGNLNFGYGPALGDTTNPVTTILTLHKSSSSVLIGSVTPTGTASQRLQVDGGAYVSGNVGIGTTTPGSKLTVSGDANISGVVTATSFSGSGTNLTGIVTSIVAGTNITVSGSTGQVTVNSTASGGGAALDILEVMLFA